MIDTPPSSAGHELSVIVPVLNESVALPALLADLRAVSGVPMEVIVVDGGSTDGTVALAQRMADKLVTSAPGRAAQMNAGAAVATGAMLWFLHADTRLASDLAGALKKILENQPVWGRFDVRLSGDHAMFRVIEGMMNWRSRFSGIATGDQGIFVRRDIFLEIGGFAAVPLMEDIDVSRRLKRLAKPRCLRARLTTSSRRWEQHGIWRTVALMWQLRWRYWRGVDPAVLARAYRRSDQ